jgi:tRNA-specific 2-thiouridylase
MQHAAIDLPGLDDVPTGARVVVAMSGGVDSSVAAALCRARGFEVVGATLQLYDAREAPTAASKTCCAGRDIRDAKRVAAAIGIPHYVLDYEARFRRAVMEDFAATYAAGATPVPCIRCNQRVKFADLLDFARDLGAAALVTGHYVRRAIGPTGAELHVAAEAARDQSYFLFATTRAQLDFVRFPLGDLPKSETRALAERFALPVAAKPDSQDICFVPDGDYAATVARLRPEARAPGTVVDLDGRTLARHEGIHHFTVGQRRGLGLGGGGEPLYVAAIEPASRRVVVGPRQALAVAACDLDETNWLGPGDAPPESGIAATVRVRSTHAGATARVAGIGGSPGLARVEFAAPETGVAPGQAAVAYDGTRVLGGGFIRRRDVLTASGPRPMTPATSAAE